MEIYICFLQDFDINHYSPNHDDNNDDDEELDPREKQATQKRRLARSQRNAALNTQSFNSVDQTNDFDSFNDNDDDGGKTIAG